jgi:hypothetical protein
MMSTRMTAKDKAAAVWGLLHHGLRPIPNWWPLPDGRCACGKAGCDSPGKHPRLKSWKPYEHRAPTEDEVRAWLKNYPQANWGLVLGEDAGLMCLDFDGRGAEALLQGRGVEMPVSASWRSHGGAKVLLS